MNNSLLFVQPGETQDLKVETNDRPYGLQLYGDGSLADDTGRIQYYLRKDACCFFQRYNVLAS